MPFGNVVKVAVLHGVKRTTLLHQNVCCAGHYDLYIVG